MKYELLATSYSAETTILDEQGEPTNDYSIIITIGIHPTDNIAPNFSKDITVISNNSQTGFQVDAQRLTAINDFITEINL